MNDEEKKAIEYLKIEYEKLMKEDNILFPLYKSDAKRLIDIIEKQSKEIEELKKEYERVRAGRNWLSEHISAQIATPELFDRLVEENYISKDKIKAKIEIRKEEKENCKDSIEEKYLLREIYVLQSLLEKE